MKKTTIALSLLLTLAASSACGRTPEEQTSSAGAQVAAVQPAPADLLRNGKMPIEGILTGGQPTPEQLERLAELGYKTVINMRAPEEKGSTDPAAVEALGMTYVSLPVKGANDVSEEGGRRLAAALAEAEHPVVVHCASGNRVGALFAMKAFHVDGGTAEDALALGRAAGVTRLEPVVQRQLGLE